jgi:hypothetical protein
MVVPSESIQEWIDALFTVSMVLPIAGLWMMHFQIRKVNNHLFTVPLTPTEIKNIVRVNRKEFPQSVFRKFVGYGSLAAALAAVGISAFFSLRNS